MCIFKPTMSSVTAGLKQLDPCGEEATLYALNNSGERPATDSLYAMSMSVVNVVLLEELEDVLRVGCGVARGTVRRDSDPRS